MTVLATDPAMPPQKSCLAASFVRFSIKVGSGRFVVVVLTAAVDLDVDEEDGILK